MPNAINFGPAMPGKKYTAHNAREYKEIADLALICRCSLKCYSPKHAPLAATSPGRTTGHDHARVHPSASTC